MKYLNVLTIMFKTPIARKEIPLFRGAIINCFEESDVLFHNHLEEGFRYSYPLIQYKRINRCAAITCVGLGTEAIADLFNNYKAEITIGNELRTLEINNIKAQRTLINIWNDLLQYNISWWLPLNGENYATYIQTESLVEKYTMLENILTGNILSFAKGVGIHFDKQVICKITNIRRTFPVEYKGVRMMAFNATFKCNVSLPDNIGLGKGVSMGNGVIRQKKEIIDKAE